MSSLKHKWWFFSYIFLFSFSLIVLIAYYFCNYYKAKWLVLSHWNSFWSSFLEKVWEWRLKKSKRYLKCSNKNLCQKDKGITRWALEGNMRNYWQIFFHIWNKTDKLFTRYHKKDQFQQQLEVPPQKQTLLRNEYIEEKYFTFFLYRNVLLTNVFLINSFIKLFPIISLH